MTDDPVTIRELQVQALLAEYTGLRQESMSAISNRTTIANFTFVRLRSSSRRWSRRAGRTGRPAW